MSFIEADCAASLLPSVVAHPPTGTAAASTTVAVFGHRQQHRHSVLSAQSSSSTSTTTTAITTVADYHRPASMTSDSPSYAAATSLAAAAAAPHVTEDGDGGRDGNEVYYVHRRRRDHDGGGLEPRFRRMVRRVLVALTFQSATPVVSSRCLSGGGGGVEPSTGHRGEQNKGRTTECGSSFLMTSPKQRFGSGRRRLTSRSSTSSSLLSTSGVSTWSPRSSSKTAARHSVSQQHPVSRSTCDVGNVDAAAVPSATVDDGVRCCIPELSYELIATSSDDNRDDNVDDNSDNETAFSPVRLTNKPSITPTGCLLTLRLLIVLITNL